MASRASVRLAAFAATLALLFGAGLAAGDAFGPERDTPAPRAHDGGHSSATGAMETNR